jgi:hypothetical protein
MAHPDRQLQKEKGRGKPLGCAVITEEQEGCLEKSRQKMKLLVEALPGKDSKGPGAGMKKRQAKARQKRLQQNMQRLAPQLSFGWDF